MLVTTPLAMLLLSTVLDSFSKALLPRYSFFFFLRDIVLAHVPRLVLSGPLTQKTKKTFSTPVSHPLFLLRIPLIAISIAIR